MATTTVGGAFVGGGADVGDTKYGWAVQGGVKFNLRMLGRWRHALPAGCLRRGRGELPRCDLRPDRQLHHQLPRRYRRRCHRTGGSIKLGKGYSLVAALDHYWAPNFDTAIFGGYTKWEQNNGALTGVALNPAIYASTFAQARDFAVWQVGVQATWVPVKGIKFAGTVNYYNVEAQKASQDFLPVRRRALLRWQVRQRRCPGRASYPARLLSLFSSQGELDPGAKAPGFLFVVSTLWKTRPSCRSATIRAIGFTGPCDPCPKVRDVGLPRGSRRRCMLD